MNGRVSMGYLSRHYARSFSEFGTPVYLPNAKGWLLMRDIPGAPGVKDAMGCYPLFCCKDWRALCQDVNCLEQGLVSLVLITDPTADVDEALLRLCFDTVQPYRQHYVVDTSKALTEFVNKSHQRHAVRALRDVRVEVCEHPGRYVDEWIRLFEILAHRHSISGMRRFSRQAFQVQLAVPGMVMFRASVNGRTVGLDLWYQQDDVAQGHLTAFDELGYEYHAAYATKMTLLEYFSKRVRLINLGAGRAADGSDGLSYFKSGFSTGTKTSWLSGRIFQKKTYEELSMLSNSQLKNYFPEYRAQELL